jgi:hypothetical protein
MRLNGVARREHGEGKPVPLSGPLLMRRSQRKGSLAMADEGVFDVIVIGAGPVGITAAARAVRGGLTAAVVERRLAGGECQHYGCIPSKALLWPMALAAEVSRMPGLELRGPLDAAAVLARRPAGQPGRPAAGR